MKGAKAQHNAIPGRQRPMFFEHDRITSLRQLKYNTDSIVSDGCGDPDWFLAAKHRHQLTPASLIMSSSRVSFFDRLNRMTEDALRGSGSRRVLSAPNASAQDQPRTPDPRRVQSSPSKQWAQLPTSESIQRQSVESFESSTSMLGMPEPQQLSPDPSPSEPLVARRSTRPPEWNRASPKPTRARNQEANAGPESPLEKVLDSFTQKVRSSDTFEDLSENWEEIDDMLQGARDAMQGRRPEESPTLESLVERLRDLDNSDVKNWPVPLNVKNTESRSRQPGILKRSGVRK